MFSTVIGIAYIAVQFPLIYAADKRECNNLAAFLICIFLTPVVGCLYILCYDSKEEKILLRRQNELLSSINAKLKEQNEKLSTDDNVEIPTIVENESAEI